MTAPVFPTPDQVAHAIVAACREFGEDPIAVASGEKGSAARYIAFAALRERFPTVPPVAVARMLGLTAAAFQFAKNAQHAMKLPRWKKDRAARVLRVLAAIPEAVAAPVALAPRAVVALDRAPPALRVKTNAGEVVAPLNDVVIRRGPPLKPAPVPLRAPIVRPSVKVAGDVAPSLMGDPPPGRSALERKQG
jgi:hypothetical protein